MQMAQWAYNSSPNTILLHPIDDLYLYLYVKVRVEIIYLSKRTV
jgi:hypothetical protein